MSNTKAKPGEMFVYSSRDFDLAPPSREMTPLTGLCYKIYGVLKITARSRLVGLTVKLHRISYVPKDSWHVTHSRTSFIRTFTIRSVKYLDQFFLSTTCTVYENAWNKLWPDLEGEKDFNDDHREEITDFVQSFPGFQRGCGSPLVKVLDHDRHVMSSSPVPLKDPPCRAAMHVKSVES
ncbi:hypothetical protein TNCV_4797421 [Trichonephila clavipes]|nr:hypothetical protein TNCV_4797421 [Trichonephila clavipes]